MGNSFGIKTKIKVDEVSNYDQDKDDNMKKTVKPSEETCDEFIKMITNDAAFQGLHKSDRHVIKVLLRTLLYDKAIDDLNMMFEIIYDVKKKETAKRKVVNANKENASDNQGRASLPSTKPGEPEQLAQIFLKNVFLKNVKTYCKSFDPSYQIAIENMMIFLLGPRKKYGVIIQLEFIENDAVEVSFFFDHHKLNFLGLPVRTTEDHPPATRPKPVPITEPLDISRVYAETFGKPSASKFVE